MHNRIKLHAFFFGKNNERKGISFYGENGFMFRYQEVEAWDFRCSLYCCFQQVSFLRSKQNFYQSVCSRIWSKH